MIERGGIYWVELGAPRGSRPAKRRPVVVVSADAYNSSRLATVLALVVTSNTDLAAMPGNVFLPAAVSGLPRDSAINVTAIVTLDKSDLTELSGLVPSGVMAEVATGLRRVMDL